jgi:geranylgeranyl reductase family protein
MSAPAAEQRRAPITADAGNDADVLVVGAGPSGSSAAYWLASAGLDVAVLEKTTFPREKVCGDGLTPRGTRALVEMGIDVSERNGWLHNRGLRVIGGGQRLHLDWPDLTSFPPFGLVRPRADLDALLINQAVKAGARLYEQTSATEPILDNAGRVVGVHARTADKKPVTFRAPLVLTCEGVSGKLAQHLGVHRNDKRPLGVAVRRYYTSPKTHDDYLESWLELWDGKPNESALLPGYGWIFGMGDGTVNVGLGILNTSEAFGKVDYADLLKQWLKVTPEEWQFRDEFQTVPIRGAALPMGFNRQPHYTRGVMLIGDAAGAVNPFNGEGIAYAMESGVLAAEVAVQALARPAGPPRETALQAYPAAMKAAYGGYYTLGRVFVQLIGNPRVMQLATRHGLPHPLLMKFTLKLLANLTDPRGGDAMDRVINGLAKVVPAA